MFSSLAQLSTCCVLYRSQDGEVSHVHDNNKTLSGVIFKLRSIYIQFGLGRSLEHTIQTQHINVNKENKKLKVHKSTAHALLAKYYRVICEIQIIKINYEYRHQLLPGVAFIKNGQESHFRSQMWNKLQEVSYWSNYLS